MSLCYRCCWGGVVGLTSVGLLLSVGFGGVRILFFRLVTCGWWYSFSLGLLQVWFTSAGMVRFPFRVF